MRTPEEQQEHQNRENAIGQDPQPGHIYRTSWGYDQTNVEYFQVIKRTPATVTVRRIGAGLSTVAYGPSPTHGLPTGTSTPISGNRTTQPRPTRFADWPSNPTDTATRPASAPR